MSTIVNNLWITIGNSPSENGFNDICGSGFVFLAEPEGEYRAKMGRPGMKKPAWGRFFWLFSPLSGRAGLEFSRYGGADEFGLLA